MAFAQANTTLNDKEQAVLKRVSNRYLWFLMICLMINFVDRTNIGFAALTMNKDLGLTATTFGLAGTALSVAYLLFEIPSNLILERVGARKWLARIMITWGIASAATMFATGPWSLAGLRALVGIAEAGFAPGLVLYMTYWYPQYRRASAQTMFMLGQPLAGMLSATVGGFILGLNGNWGLAGWQWLFLLEGAPALIFGFWMYFHLADKPKDAKFLSDDEKSTLINLLERDEEARRRAQPAGPKRSITRMVLGRNMLLLSFAYACLICTVSAQGLWLPQIVRGFSSVGMPTWQIGLIVAIPPACSILWMIYWTRHSDRQSERFWHCVIPMLIAAAGWATSGLSSSPVVELCGLIVASAFSLSAWPVFFTTPSIILPREAHAPGLAFLNTVAIAGSSLSPIIVGRLRDITGGFSIPLLAVSGILILGVITMLFVPRDLLSQKLAEPAPAIA
ncbi:MAG TPA: MFS transporter [Stellaceae bacterium]|jgi:ACS family 4-hydroxyphenylacetate permease-like MFS transporter|nr:MFS transporter [Stellaceae bacterium]